MDDRAFQANLAEIRDDRASGAGALARRCLAILAASAEAAPARNAEYLGAVLRDRAAALAAARPSMAPVPNLIRRWRAALPPAASDLEGLRTAAAETARRVSRDSEAATAQAARLAAGHLYKSLAGHSAPVILTLSWSAVVAQALAALAVSDAEVRVAESRPLNEGARLAEFLAGEGLAVTLITDAQMAQAAARAALGICGADTLLADGTVVNKTGTAPMALALKDAGRPLIAACESFKLTPASVPLTFEEMDGAELGYGEGRPFAVRNVYFEAVPPRLIDAWVTENGVARAPDDLTRLNPLPAPVPD